MSYDTSCYDLAEFFLEGEIEIDKAGPEDTLTKAEDRQAAKISHHADLIAQQIQDVIEGYIKYELRGVGASIPQPDQEAHADHPATK